MSDWKTAAIAARKEYERLSKLATKLHQESFFNQRLWKLGIQPDSYGGRMPKSFGEVTAFVGEFAFEWWADRSGNAADGSIHMWIRCKQCNKYLPLGSIHDLADVGYRLLNWRNDTQWHKCDEQG